MGCKKYWNFQMNHCAMTPKAGFCSNIVHNGTNVLLAFCQQIHRPLEEGETCSFLFWGDQNQNQILFSKLALFFQASTLTGCLCWEAWPWLFWLQRHVKCCLFQQAWLADELCVKQMRCGSKSWVETWMNDIPLSSLPRKSIALPMPHLHEPSPCACHCFTYAQVIALQMRK